MTGGMRCSSSCKPDLFVLALLYDARPRLLLCESWTVEKQRSVLSSPEQSQLNDMLLLLLLLLLLKVITMNYH